MKHELPNRLHAASINHPSVEGMQGDNNSFFHHCLKIRTSLSKHRAKIKLKPPFEIFFYKCSFVSSRKARNLQEGAKCDTSHVYYASRLVSQTTTQPRADRLQSHAFECLHFFVSIVQVVICAAESVFLRPIASPFIDCHTRKES